jgi:hypothetical protein
MRSDRPLLRARRVKASLAVLGPALALGAVLLLRRGGSPPVAAPVVEQTPQVSAAPPVTRAPSSRVVVPLPPSRPSPAGSGALPPDLARAIEDGPQEPLVPQVLNIDVPIAPRGAVTAEPLVPRTLEIPEPTPARGAAPSSEPLAPRDTPLPPE